MLSVAAASTQTPSFASPSDDPYLDVFEAASIPNVHPQTIRKAAREGRLRFLKVNGGRVLRFRRSWVLAWLENSSSFSN